MLRSSKPSRRLPFCGGFSGFGARRLAFVGLYLLGLIAGSRENLGAVAKTASQAVRYISGLPAAPSPSEAPAAYYSQRHFVSTAGITLDLYSCVLPGVQEDAAARVDEAGQIAEKNRAENIGQQSGRKRRPWN